MERIVEISSHYGKNDGNVIFCYFSVQRTGLTLRSESWPALSTKTFLIQKQMIMMVVNNKIDENHRMKRRRAMSDVSRQLNRWVMELANYLMNEKCMDYRLAFRKAHLTKNLLKALGEGKVMFTYRKKDGLLRTAHGTLRHGICHEYDAYHYTSHVSEDEGKEWPYSHFAYWDLDRQCFRSFRAEDLEDYQKMELDPQTEK